MEKDTKKTEMLDEEQSQEDEQEGTDSQEVMDDPGEQLRMLCRGTLRLMKPIRAHGQDVKEIQYDLELSSHNKPSSPATPVAEAPQEGKDTSAPPPQEPPEKSENTSAPNT